MKTITMICAVAVLASCASNPRVEDLSSEQRAKAAKIRNLLRQPARSFQIIGTVSGLFCNRNKYQQQDMSNAEALQGLRINAALMKADAVINTFCQTNSDIDWVNNCWASVKCIGNAVRL
jgi:uncharacterized protein YbjQ (UPF0145 family)